MKLLILFVLGFIGCNGQSPFKKNTSQTSGMNNIDVYLRIGDSNEAGGSATEDSTFPAKYHTVLKNTLIYVKPDRTVTNNGVWYNYSDSNPTINRFSGYGPIQNIAQPWGVGPDISFAYSIDSAIKTKVGIIKCALGGTRLLSEWAVGGSMYNFFFSYSYPVGVPYLTASLPYKRANIKAAIVILGTNDCTTGNYNDANFKAAIQTMVTTLRTTSGVSDLPIYWVQVNTNLGLVSGFSAASVTSARAALTACATFGNPAYISNFTLLNYDADGLLPDGVHYNQNACISQGIYEAYLMLGLTPP